MDIAGNLYVADSGRIQKRDARGNWSLIAGAGGDAGAESIQLTALAVDVTGDLYAGGGDIRERDTGGNWSDLDVPVSDWPTSGPVAISALAVDSQDNIYLAAFSSHRQGDFSPLEFYFQIRKRDAQGNWAAIATEGTGLGHVQNVSALAADMAGNLYVADAGDAGARIQRRDALGNWSVIATEGVDPGQVASPSGLAVDGAGNLYVADTGNDRVMKYTPGGSP